MGSRSACQARGTTLSRSPSGCGCGSASPNNQAPDATLSRGHSHIPSARLRTRSLNRSLSRSLSIRLSDAELSLSREDCEDSAALS